MEIFKDGWRTTSKSVKRHFLDISSHGGKSIPLLLEKLPDVLNSPHRPLKCHSKGLKNGLNNIGLMGVKITGTILSNNFKHDRIKISA